MSRIMANGWTPPLSFDGPELQTANRVTYTARYPNGCVVRGRLKILDAYTFEAPPTRAFPAGTLVEMHVHWENGEAMTVPSHVEVVDV